MTTPQTKTRVRYRGTFINSVQGGESIQQVDVLDSIAEINNAINSANHHGMRFAELRLVDGGMIGIQPDRIIEVVTKDAK